MADTVQQHVQQLDINLIQPNPHQPRKTIDPEDMSDLVDSIKIHGVLEPIVIAHTPAGYQIIAGERRWRAAKLAGLEKIPALVKKTSPRGMLEMSIIENVQRSDLNPIERAHAINRLAEEFQLSPSQISRQIGKSMSYITNSVKLLTLPDALKDGLLSGLITEGHARALLGIADVKQMVEAYKTILKENGSVRRAEELARRAREATGQEVIQRRPQIIVSKDIDRWEQQLHSALGKKSEVRLRRSFRQTVLTIKLQGSLQDTQQALDTILSIANKKSAATEDEN